MSNITDVSAPIYDLIYSLKRLEAEVYWAREIGNITTNIRELYFRLEAVDRKAIVLQVINHPELLDEWFVERREIMENIQGLQEYRDSMLSQPQLPRE